MARGAYARVYMPRAIIDEARPRVMRRSSWRVYVIVTTTTDSHQRALFRVIEYLYSALSHLSDVFR